MKKSIIKQAKTREEAIRLALSEIGKTRNEVDVEVLEEESSGFLGLIGAKDAVVRISYDEDISKALENLENEIKNDSFSNDKELNENYDVKDRSKYFKEEAEAFYESPDFNKEDRQAAEFEKEGDEFEAKIKDLKDHETNLGEYEISQKINSYEKNIKTSKDDKKEIDDNSNDKLDDNLLEELNIEDKTQSENVDKIVIEPKRDFTYEKQQTDIDKYYKAKEFLEGILKEMHLESASVYGNLEGSMIKLDAKVDEKDTGIAIGKQGSTLDAIELLVRKAISSRSSNLRVNIDINNYKKRRDEKIRELAAQTAEKVAKSKKARNLKYMNSYERRLAHEEISKHKNVTSHSEGTEPKRYVVVTYLDENEEE